jgi:predicted nucleic-acid-binding protein
VIAIDTNVVVRLLARDDIEQAKQAERLFESNNDLFIPKTVVLETEWVLRYAYELDRKTIIQGFRKLFGLENVALEEPAVIATALEWHEEGLDFADAIHLASCQKSRFATFDRAFVKKASKAGLTSVIEVSKLTAMVLITIFF